MGSHEPDPSHSLHNLQGAYKGAGTVRAGQIKVGIRIVARRPVCTCLCLFGPAFPAGKKFGGKAVRQLPLSLLPLLLQAGGNSTWLVSARYYRRSSPALLCLLARRAPVSTRFETPALPAVSFCSDC